MGCDSCRALQTYKLSATSAASATFAFCMSSVVVVVDRLIVEKEERIMQLESAVEQAAEATVDKDKLLEVIQSDKTALSRAVAQNKELKNQLAELQNSFVKMVCTRNVMTFHAYCMKLYFHPSWLKAVLQTSVL